MGRVKARIKRKPRDHLGRQWTSPKEQYLYSPEPITVSELCVAWKGYKGCSESMLTKRCEKEGWVKRRKEYQGELDARAEDRYLEAQSDSRAKMIEDANVRHMQMGRAMQGIGGKYAQGARTMMKSKKKMAKASPSDFGRTAARLIKDGVDVERKGLGLAERIVNVHFVREITREVLVVIQKYVVDPDVYENILRDLEAIGGDQREELEKLYGEEDL